MKSQRIFKLFFLIGVIISLISFSLAHAGHDHDHDHEHDHDHDHDHDHEHDHDHPHDIEDTTTDDEFINHINHTILVMGYDKLKTITKKQFRTFFEKLVFMDEVIQDEETVLMEKIYEKLSADVPEEIETGEISKYLGMEKIYGIINQVSEEMGLNNSEPDFSEIEKELQGEEKPDL
jgi:hypothetical protein